MNIFANAKTKHFKNVNNISCDTKELDTNKYNSEKKNRDNSPDKENSVKSNKHLY